MKKTIIFVILVSSFVFLTACASDDEIADELIDYYNNEWIPIHAMKRSELGTAKEDFRKIMMESGEDHEKEAIELHENDIIPVIDKVVDQFESIELRHRKIKKLNKMQIKAEKHGRDLMQNGIDYFKGDASKSKYIQKDNELKRKYDEVNEYLEKLMDIYNLEYDRKKDSIEGYYELKRKEE